MAPRKSRYIKAPRKNERGHYELFGYCTTCRMSTKDGARCEDCSNYRMALWIDTKPFKHRRRIEYLEGKGKHAR